MVTEAMPSRIGSPKNLHQTITKNMNPDKFPLEALTESCIECDEVCIAPPEGFWASFGERGIVFCQVRAVFGFSGNR